MITVHRSTESGLTTIAQPEKGSWIEVTGLNREDAGRLAEDLGIPLEFVHHALDPDEVPRVDKAGEAVFILVRVPAFQGHTAKAPYITTPIGIVVANERVVTLCHQKSDILRHLPEDHRNDLSTDHPTRFVLHLIWGVGKEFLHHQNEIDQVVERLEERLRHSMKNREVLDLLRYQKSMVHFTTALQENANMFERLQRGEFLKLDRRDADLLDAAFTENRQALVVTRVASEILGQMVDAFASIISNNLNDVMKFMTSATIVLIIPQIIGTFYGMNVRLPMEDNPAAFAFLVGLAFAISFIVAVIFRKKDWM